MHGEPLRAGVEPVSSASPGTGRDCRRRAAKRRNPPPPYRAPPYRAERAAAATMSNRDWTTMTWKPPPPWETVMDPGRARGAGRRPFGPRAPAAAAGFAKAMKSRVVRPRGAPRFRTARERKLGEKQRVSKAERGAWRRRRGDAALEKRSLGERAERASSREAERKLGEERARRREEQVETPPRRRCPRERSLGERAEGGSEKQREQARERERARRREERVETPRPRRVSRGAPVRRRAPADREPNPPRPTTEPWPTRFIP